MLVSIDGAVRQLAKIPFVDTARMGVQGHSHGGYETNIIATGCHYFKAACEGSGYSNVISEYGSLRPGGMNNQRASDIDQRNSGSISLGEAGSICCQFSRFPYR